MLPVFEVQSGHQSRGCRPPASQVSPDLLLPRGEQAGPPLLTGKHRWLPREEARIRDQWLVSSLAAQDPHCGKSRPKGHATLHRGITPL